MFGYPHFIPEFVQSTNSSLFWFKIANELSEFRNYLNIVQFKSQKVVNFLLFSGINRLFCIFRNEPYPIDVQNTVNPISLA